MASARKAIHHVLQMEGGYVNDPDDPGGETKYGISSAAYPNVDIKNLTKEKAREIYRRDWWEPLRLDDVHDTDMAAEILDTAVNMGPRPDEQDTDHPFTWAVKFAQMALSALGYRVNIDGKIGPETVKNLNRVSYTDRDPLLKIMNGLQFMRYWKIQEENPEQAKFMRGWMRRIDLQLMFS